MTKENILIVYKVQSLNVNPSVIECNLVELLAPQKQRIFIQKIKSRLCYIFVRKLAFQTFSEGKCFEKMFLLSLFLLEIHARATFNCGCSSIVLVDVRTNKTIANTTEIFNRKLTTTKPEVKPLPTSTTSEGCENKVYENSAKIF